MAGTLVWVLPSGANPKETPPSEAIAKPIEQVRAGEWVLTREEGTGKVGWVACLEGAQTVGGRERVSVRQGGTGEVEGDEGTSFFMLWVKDGRGQVS